MTKLLLFVLALLLCLQLEAAQAQSVLPPTGNPIPPAESLQPTQSPCSAGSQSVRVCNDDFRSCGSVCTATALDPTADIAGCGLRCCSQFKACLSIRQCNVSGINCF
jgi:hypothetical protein